MSELNCRPSRATGTNFLREVEERVEEGEWVKMCMQCGVCAGSCPLGTALGTFAAEDIHDDPRRQARRSAELGLDVDVHLLL